MSKTERTMTGIASDGRTIVVNDFPYSLTTLRLTPLRELLGRLTLKRNRFAIRESHQRRHDSLKVPFMGTEEQGRQYASTLNVVGKSGTPFVLTDIKPSENAPDAYRIDSITPQLRFGVLTFKRGEEVDNA